jgi:hypothetical protein
MLGSDPLELKELETRIRTSSAHVFGNKPLGALVTRLNVLATIDFLALKTMCFLLNMDGIPVVHGRDKVITNIHREQVITEAGPSGLNVGDKVEGLYKARRWYPAIISSKNPDGTFTLDWEDGDSQDRIKKPEEVRLINDTTQVVKEQEQIQAGTPNVRRANKPNSSFYCGRMFTVIPSSGLKIGDKVEGLYKNRRWYPAVISSKNSDGTFTVDWQDGDSQDRIKKPEEVRLIKNTKPVIMEQEQIQVVCSEDGEQCISCSYSQLYPHRFLLKKKNAQLIRRLFNLVKERTIKDVLSGHDFSARNGYDLTPLHFASKSGWHDAVLALVNNGADLNVKDKDQNSPLDLASNVRCSEMLKLLGADKWTPLMVAAEKGDEKIEVYMHYRNALISLHKQLPFEPSFVEIVDKTVLTKEMQWNWGYVEKNSMQIDESCMSVARISENSGYSSAVGSKLLSSGIHKWAIHVENVQSMWVGIARGVENAENGLSSSPGEKGEYMLAFGSDGNDPVIFGENLPSFHKVDKQKDGDEDDASDTGSQSRESHADSEEPDEEQSGGGEEENSSDEEGDDRSSMSVAGYGINFTSNQTIELELDLDTHTLKVRVDGRLQAIARNVDSKGVRPFVCMGSFESAKILFNSEICRGSLDNIDLISADDKGKAFDNKLWTPELNTIMSKHPNSGASRFFLVELVSVSDQRIFLTQLLAITC